MNQFHVKNVLAAGVFLLLFGCSTTDTAKPNVKANSTVSATTEQKKDVDPWQNYNRAMFSFNMTVDRFLLKPVANAYVFVTPSLLRRGVDNVFSNILEVPSVLNGVLQGNIKSAGHDTGRILINTTLGIGGIFDVARHTGLKDSNYEDFGQTLAVWGVKSGPYVVLPLLGPSTLRDTTAVPVDWYTDPKSYIQHIPTKNTVRAISVVNSRANLLQLEKNIPGDKYTFIRDAYLQSRNFQIKNGVVEDGFGDDDFPDESSADKNPSEEKPKQE